jgi:uncharacterized protein YndB with AHSA1/START domain
MFKLIALVVVVLIAGVLGFAATRPDAFRVERAVTIKAPPGKIYPYLDDFNRWAAWSPWEKLDPAMKRTFSGAPSGKGAAYAWAGNSKVGAGRMEIIESTPASKLLIKLDFLEPFEGHNTADFTLEPAGDDTKVTWAMVGPAPYISKLMGVFVNMDKMIGKDFEAGLANLKAAAEK